MAGDSCCGGGAPPISAAPAKPGSHIVHCVKFDKDKEAWKLWIEHSKMLMNEYRLNPLDPASQKVMEDQMEQFFFGEGAKLPEGYVAPKAKG
jgi:Fe-S cluster biosynthesis and repair protein YggX